MGHHGESLVSKTRPPIPPPIQREVRQRCGFGCVMCGSPLYEYHHMDGNPGNSMPANITLLCGLHHTEATKLLLPAEQIARANVLPVNVQRGVSSPYGLHFNGEGFSCTIGGNRFSSRLRDNEQATCAIVVA